jgi:hypothetical protein
MALVVMLPPVVDVKFFFTTKVGRTRKRLGAGIFSARCFNVAEGFGVVKQSEYAVCRAFCDHDTGETATMEANGANSHFSSG